MNTEAGNTDIGGKWRTLGRKRETRAKIRQKTIGWQYYDEYKNVKIRKNRKTDKNKTKDEQIKYYDKYRNGEHHYKGLNEYRAWKMKPRDDKKKKDDQITLYYDYYRKGETNIWENEEENKGKKGKTAEN